MLYVVLTILNRGLDGHYQLHNICEDTLHYQQVLTGTYKTLIDTHMLHDHVESYEDFKQAYFGPNVLVMNEPVEVQIFDTVTNKVYGENNYDAYLELV